MRIAIAMLAAVLLLAVTPVRADEKPMTNQDVISMIKAKMSESTILMAIRSAKPGFDTSANGLIKLSAASASDAIVQAVIEANGRKGSGNASAGGGGGGGGSAASAASAANPEEVTMYDGGTKVPMRYLAPQMRGAARALGFGGYAQYSVLNGTAAALRVKSKQPSFVVAIPSNAQPESYYTIASFAVRRNGSREVLVGGGYMSYSTGINKDRVVKATAVQESNQTAAPKNYIMYRVTPDAPMAPGEYAFILYNSQVKVAGYFASGLDSYFDFGID